ncbi:MAG: hypothetical protein ACOCZ2_02125, partial [Thermodesulfobacteriota bacterium]
IKHSLSMPVFVISRPLVGVFLVTYMCLVGMAVFMFVSRVVGMSVLMRMFMMMRVFVAVLVDVRSSVSMAVFMYMGMQMLVLVAVSLIATVVVRVNMHIYFIGCTAIACFAHNNPPVFKIFLFRIIF